MRDRRTLHEAEAIHRPGRFGPRAGGGGSRPSAFGKAYQSCSPCLLEPLNRLGCSWILRILSSSKERGRGRARREEGRARGEESANAAEGFRARAPKSAESGQEFRTNGRKSAESHAADDSALEKVVRIRPRALADGGGRRHEPALRPLRNGGQHWLERAAARGQSIAHAHGRPGIDEPFDHALRLQP